MGRKRRVVAKTVTKPALNSERTTRINTQVPTVEKQRHLNVVEKLRLVFIFILVLVACALVALVIERLIHGKDGALQKGLKAAVGNDPKEDKKQDELLFWILVVLVLLVASGVIGVVLREFFRSETNSGPESESEDDFEHHQAYVKSEFETKESVHGISDLFNSSGEVSEFSRALKRAIHDGQNGRDLLEHMAQSLNRPFLMVERNADKVVGLKHFGDHTGYDPMDKEAAAKALEGNVVIMDTVGDKPGEEYSFMTSKPENWTNLHHWLNNPDTHKE